jgi:glucose-6-phosphate 1-dehydrogenase
MVRHGHLDVPVIGVARAGRTNEHLKERVPDSIQQQRPGIDQEALAKLLEKQVWAIWRCLSLPVLL